MRHAPPYAPVVSRDGRNANVGKKGFFIHTNPSQANDKEKFDSPSLPGWLDSLSSLLLGLHSKA
jgi:hypothetical protein